MKVINLLPKSEQKEARLHFFASQLLTFWVWLVVSLVVFFGLALAAKFYLNQQSGQEDAQIAAQSQELKSSNNLEIKQQIDNLNTQIANVKNITNQHYYWSQALTELGNMVPSGMHIVELNLNRTTGQVTMQGTADNRDDILEFWSNMHKSQYFTNIDFPLANLDKATDDPYKFDFQINPSQITKPQ